jgi:hypothetical protein
MEVPDHGSGGAINDERSGPVNAGVDAATVCAASMGFVSYMKSLGDSPYFVTASHALFCKAKSARACNAGKSAGRASASCTAANYMFLDNPFTRSTGRPGSKKMAKPISFSLLAPEANAVCIVGDFNNWKPGATPLTRRPDGGWIGQVEMPHGHHRYVFLVDEQRVLDPRATGITRDDKNERVSLIAVS